MPRRHQAALKQPRPAEMRSCLSGASLLELYLREAGQVDLLAPEEEVALAKRIRQGDEEARDHMIRANLRLVVKVAREYENLGLPLLDLINEGNMGLMKGVDRFDPTKGAKLSTYAA
jgi:RNA polymerase primary sigma factor